MATVIKVNGQITEVEDFLTPGQVAQIFRVDSKTVTRWGTSGKLTSIRTPGGHRRYLAAEVKAILDDTRHGGPS